MALIVGTDTYISVADANTYLANMGYDALPVGQEEGLLRRATKTIDRRYGNRYIGTKTLSTQPLLWPRFLSNQFAFFQYNALGDIVNWNSSTIPTELGEATAELARMIDAGVDVYEQPARPITSKSVGIDGAVSESITFGGAVVERSSDWNRLEQILAPLLGTPRGPTGTTTMTRGA